METRDHEIDLREYFQIIRKRIWIIILLVVISVAVSGIVSFYVLEPVYEAFTTLIVSKPNERDTIIEYSDVLLSQQLVKTYGEIIKSRNISTHVIINLSLNITSEELRKKITVSPVKNTEIVQIKVTDTNPELARDIANELTKVFMKDIKRIMKIDNVQIIDSAEIPLVPIKPKPKLNMIVAGFLGITAGLGIMFLMEYLDNTLKTPEDIERYFGVSVIGTIPDINKKIGKKVKRKTKVKAEIEV